MIEKYIIDALLKRGKIVVPSLGTFKASLVSAEVYDSGTLLVPPNNDIDFSDDIFDLAADSLVDFIYEQENQTLDSAQIESDIELFVKDIDRKIEEEGEAVIAELGTFRKGSFGDMEFSRGEDVNLLAESFGLPKLAVRPIVEIDQTAKVPAKSGSTAWIVVLTPLVMLSIFLLYLFFDDAAYQKLAGIFQEPAQEEVLPPDREEANVPEREEDNPVESEKENLQDENPEGDTSPKEGADTPSGQEDQEEKEVKTKPVPEAPNTDNDPLLVNDKTNRFYLIIGSFSKLNSAKKAVSEANAKGYPNAKILPNGAKFRVSVSDYAKKGEAQTALGPARNDYTGAWVLPY